MELKETSAIISCKKTNGWTSFCVLCVQTNPRLDILVIETALLHGLHIIELIHYARVTSRLVLVDPYLITSDQPTSNPELDAIRYGESRIFDSCVLILYP